jgi:hypothetical protein
MPTLAPPLPPPPSAVRPVGNGVPVLGTALDSGQGAVSFHGRDLRIVFQTMLDLRRRNEELMGELLAATQAREPAEDFDYAPVPPRRSFYIDVLFERGHVIDPVPYEPAEE